ncbi:MAG: hypothetical protein FWF49_06250 [Oscillospiraceae bacterium]|nr:hypothetical protein [Oscillospiraceae bacterium]
MKQRIFGFLFAALMAAALLGGCRGQAGTNDTSGTSGDAAASTTVSMAATTAVPPDFQCIIYGSAGI